MQIALGTLSSDRSDAEFRFVVRRKSMGRHVPGGGRRLESGTVMRHLSGHTRRGGHLVGAPAPVAKCRRRLTPVKLTERGRGPRLSPQTRRPPVAESSPGRGGSGLPT